jgi:hypothetical protein
MVLFYYYMIKVYSCKSSDDMIMLFYAFTSYHFYFILDLGLMEVYQCESVDTSSRILLISPQENYLYDR